MKAARSTARSAASLTALSFILLATAQGAQSATDRQPANDGSDNTRAETVMTGPKAQKPPRRGLARAPYISREFLNTDCNRTKSCDLKSFKMEVWKSATDSEQHDPSVDDLFQGELMVASYETKDIGTLEKFGIVQFIKGCNIGVTKQQGKTLYYINSQRSFFDFQSAFLHTDWQVDSIDRDPMYASVPYDPSRYGMVKPSDWKRHAGLRVFKPNPFIDETPAQQAAYQFKTPPEPRLYIFDYPTGSYAGSDRRNGDYTYSSMQFRTCVFKIEDIPADAHPDWNGNGKALACFEWSNNHRYDSTRDLYVDAKDIDPRCERKAWADEIYVDWNTPLGEKPLDWSKKSRDLGIPAQSCDATYGAQLPGGGFFAGDLCVDAFHSGKDTSKFLTPVGKQGQVAPNPFLVGKLVAGGGTSVKFSTVRTERVNDLAAIFDELRTRALAVISRGTSASEVDAAIAERLKNMRLALLPQGPGCEGGAELDSSYNAAANVVEMCPGWTRLPREAQLENLSKQIARAIDVCGIKPLFKLTPAFVADLKKATPTKVAACFKSVPDLNSPQVIGAVNEMLISVVDAGYDETETIQSQVDAALVKCKLIEPSSRKTPGDFSSFAGRDLWACARKASGDKSPNSPVGKPWTDKEVCSERVRDITQSAFAADLMSYYLARDPNVAQPGTGKYLLFGQSWKMCIWQGLTDKDVLGSLERMGLYLAKPEIRQGVGCTDTSAPALCESKLFSSP